MCIRDRHETILEVNLGAMIANLNYYRGKLKPETKDVYKRQILNCM